MYCAATRLTTLVVLLLSSTGVARAETKLDWEPAKTWVFVVGVLKWEHEQQFPGMAGAQKNRSDEQLVKHFRAAGVPEKQITYLQDEAATKASIEKQFGKLLEQTKDGDLLVCYYCGHGSRNVRNGRTSFANYDASSVPGSMWDVESIFTTIDEKFRGSRALLLADCCHSGALYDHAHPREGGRIAYSVVTSSYSHNTSTGRWTFTDSVLAALRGEGTADQNADGAVDLAELACYCELEMAFGEGQKSMFTAGKKFPSKAKLARVKEPAPKGAGERMEVEWNGQWYKAKCIAVDGERRKVHYTTYDDSWDEWVGPDRMRTYKPLVFPEGTKVDVQWENDRKWYPATILKSWYGMHFIRYDGYDASWDEWIGPGAIRKREE
ncbi:MAG: Tudor-knot domain-containing protein [Pirellulaceae bacterium]